MDRQVVNGVTVDSEKAQDLDDAFWVEKTPGGYRLTVSITDVSSIVEIGSMDDMGASSRGTSVYAAYSPRSSMFNANISHALASLLPGQERPVVSTIIDFDQEGVLVSAYAIRALLTSRAKLAYGDVEDIIYHPLDPLYDGICSAVELASMLWKNRAEMVDMPFWDTAFDKNGDLVEGISYGQIGKTVVHEFMIMSNIISTSLVGRANMPMIYRNHGDNGEGPNGRYEIIPKGHQTIGVDAYGQFSSPIRRYPDLVNQRILLAALDGGKEPYDKNQLAKICADSNRTIQRAEYLGKQRQPRPFIERLDFVGFRTLMEKSGVDNEALEGEIRKRLDNGRFTKSDIAYLLFNFDSNISDDLKSDILKRLAFHPETMDRIWECGFNEQKLPSFESKTVRNMSKWYSAVKAGRHTEIASADNPVRARGLALVQLASKLIGIPMPQTEYGEELKTINTEARKNLVFLCRLMDWSGPDYEVKLNTAPTRTYFDCMVRIIAGDIEYCSPIAHSSTIKGAETIAASMALAALEPFSEEVLKNEAKHHGLCVDGLKNVGKRPITALKKFCARHGASYQIIWLEENAREKVYSCLMRITAGTGVMELEGHGASRILAMEDAAILGIQTLLQRVEEINRGQWE